MAVQAKIGHFSPILRFCLSASTIAGPTSLTKSVAVTFALTDPSFSSIRIDSDSNSRQYCRNKLNPKGFEISEFQKFPKN